MVVLSVDDIDAALQDVQRLGGTVQQPRTAVGDMGFSAYFSDPEGNTLGLWQSARG